MWLQNRYCSPCLSWLSSPGGLVIYLTKKIHWAPTGSHFVHRKPSQAPCGHVFTHPYGLKAWATCVLVPRSSPHHLSHRNDRNLSGEEGDLALIRNFHINPARPGNKHPRLFSVGFLTILRKLFILL